MDSWLKGSSNAAENKEKEVNKKAKTEPTKYRQYQEEYVLMGFTSTSCIPPKALCLFCGEKLANGCMKPAHLQRHLSTKHQCHVGRPPEFFKRKLSDFRASQETMQISITSAKALEASYAVSLLVAKAKKPFTIAEDLLLPAAVVLAETMLDKNAADKFKTVPLSNDTVCRRIDTMGTDIIDHVVESPGESFSLQLDESTDVSGKAQQLLPFGSTYLCEASFSAMTLIKTKQRNRLCPEKNLITAVASLPPRMTKILSEAQAHPSH